MPCRDMWVGLALRLQEMERYAIASFTVNQLDLYLSGERQVALLGNWDNIYTVLSPLAEAEHAHHYVG